MWKKGDKLKKLARRGIGYHHRSMTAKEKQLVEILFRKGFIRVGRFFIVKVENVIIQSRILMKQGNTVTPLYFSHVAMSLGLLIWFPDCDVFAYALYHLIGKVSPCWSQRCVLLFSYRVEGWLMESCCNWGRFIYRFGADPFLTW